MSAIIIDRYDLELLAALQEDGHATNAAIGHKIHLSASQVSRRIQHLEESNVIARYAAVLNPEILGLGVIAFTYVTIERQSEQGQLFEQAIMGLAPVLECHSVTGETDYILRIAAPDLAAFSDFMTTQLLRLAGVANVKSIITLKTIKQTQSLPLDHIAQPTQAKRQVAFAGR
jgi:Lrp/AsnC family transcriptional regulator, leucine-responsive regulatory protein